MAWISLAPAKGLALVSRVEVALEPVGVRDSRRFYLIGAEGRTANGKRVGSLRQVEPDWDDQAGTLALRFPAGSVVAGEVALGEPVVTDFSGRPARGRLVLGPWSRARVRLGDPLTPE